MDGFDPVRRLCVAVGAEEGAGDGSHAWIVDVVERASMAAGLDRITLQVLPTGVLLVLNSGVNEARVVTDLTRELHNVLWRRNRRLGGGQRLRCRISFHQGLVRLTDEGFEGQAVTAVGDLCASDDLRAELAGNPQRDLAMIISGQLLDDLAYPESAGLHRGQFRQVTVTAPGRFIPAYIYTLGPAT